VVLNMKHPEDVTLWQDEYFLFKIFDEYVTH